MQILKRSPLSARSQPDEFEQTARDNAGLLRGNRARLSTNLISLCLAMIATATSLYGQSDLSATSVQTSPYGAVTLTARDTLNPNDQSQNIYLGGVPTGTASPTALPLSLEDAVARGLRQNLGGLLSSDAVSGAQGDRWRSLSALLPNVTTDTSFSVHQLDLKATIGLNFPGIPHVIGPFGAFDTRASIEQSIFNWESIQRARSSAAQMRSAQYSYKNARELIVLAVVSNYLLVIADQSEVESATAQRDTAKALFDQTTDQKKAGLAAAVDVLRSDVELQAREQRLIFARNNLAKQKIVLARAIGLPAGQAFNITTDVAFQPLTTSTLDEALQQAYTTRPDFKSLTEQVRAAELQKKAASAERYPTLAAAADYGDAAG